MEMFNAEIKPGMLALIIGVNQPCNSHMIGSIVTVEYVYAEGADLSHLLSLLVISNVEQLLPTFQDARRLVHTLAQVCKKVTVLSNPNT